MSIKFKDVMTKGDWVKMTILVILAVVCWTWVWIEYQKPIIPPEWETQINEKYVVTS